MARYEFYTGGALNSVQVQSLRSIARAPVARAAMAGARGRRATPAKTSKRASSARAAARAAKSQRSRLAPLFHDVNESDMRVIVPSRGAGPVVIVTETMALDGAKSSEVKHLRQKYGFEVVRQGSDGKYLLRAPEGGDKGIESVFAAAAESFERGQVDAAHPNFVRVLQRPKRSAAGNQDLWNYHNDGNPGVAGADVAGRAAWTITKGRADVRIAVLDEGVDTLHPALKRAVVAEKDVVDGNSHARPDGNDAHGTACAGTIVSRDSKIPGLAPECSLVAARIAKDDGFGGWVFDDFDTADAIDWCWRDAKADVLSNSWGGGPAVDGITNAINRARTRGRGRKGAIVAIAAGNDNGPVSYPGTLPGVITVGASNQWDERKSPSSRDRETWWGSNFGSQLDLLAPGVRIATTDIHGAKGYSGTNFTDSFNGTSSATPHVAAAAALIVSVAPKLTERRVREIITASADSLTRSGQRNRFVGHGRLNIFSALRLARR